MSRAKHLRPRYVFPSLSLNDGSWVPQLSSEHHGAPKHRASGERRSEARLIGHPKHSKRYPPIVRAAVSSHRPAPFAATSRSGEPTAGT